MISDAANLVNVESHVLRYWEEELNLDIPRNEMGHRYYTEENISQFIKIKEWKERGYQLKAIRMLVQQEKIKTKNSSEIDMMAPENVHKEVVEYSHSNANVEKMEQFQSIMTNIVRNVLEENNQSLGKEVGNYVGDKVIKEMNYLMRVQDEAEEERYKKLDELIRNHGKKNKMKQKKQEKNSILSRKSFPLIFQNPPFQDVPEVLSEGGKGLF